MIRQEYVKRITTVAARIAFSFLVCFAAFGVDGTAVADDAPNFLWINVEDMSSDFGVKPFVGSLDEVNRNLNTKNENEKNDYEKLTA